MHRNDFYDKLQSKLMECLFLQVTDLLGHVTIVQVGAADGVIGDPIYEMLNQGRWSGLLIDALDENCNKLSKVHAAAENIKIINSVISDCAGEIDFFSVADDNGLGYSRLSTLDYNIIKKHKIFVEDIENRIQIRKLRSDTLENICTKYQLSQPDGIFVDAEGTDDIIIKSFNFDRFVPHIVFFEHMHVPIPRLIDLNSMLESVGLRRICLWADTVYLSAQLAGDECVGSIVDAAEVLFKDRDEVWGNGNWYHA